MLNDEVKQLRNRYTERGQGHLFHNMLLFSRILRELGLDANPTRTIDLLRSLEYVDIGKKEDFYETGKAIMLRRNEEQPVYDYVFQMFWRRWVTDDPDSPAVMATPDDISNSIAPEKPPEARQKEPEKADQQQEKEAAELSSMSKQVSDGEGEDESDSGDEDVERQQTYSAGEMLQEKDFQDFTADELNEAKRLMSQLRWQLSFRLCRRFAPSRNGKRLDGRRTVRKSMKYGGVPIELSYKQRKLKPRPLVLICDVSGSMDLYSRLLLQFMHSLENGLKFVETFVFGTRLTRITHELKNKNIDESLRMVSKVVKDWSGGTKIGESLETFNHHWARRVLGHGAVVIIISDGWDRGNVETLRREMAHLQRMSYRLIWLNPLLGLPDYQPLTVGIQAALDYVDDFMPAHNFKSLEALGELLQNLGISSRPERKQAKI
jgi:uncharacterized protein